MFHHVKELQFNARVSRPDPRFARLLLEQFGGGNGELKAAMQYFVQAFAARQPYPEKYDLLMDIAAEELSHLEIVGATITMLLDGVNGELKNAAESSFFTRLTKGKSEKEDMLHEALTDPQFLVLSGGGPMLTNSQGVPWSGAYVNANGDLTVDLRSDIAAESRAKIVYEYLLQFTDDPSVQESLRFLMTREIAHFQMFTAALETIQPNFPPGILQGDPRFTHTYFNMSNGTDARGPWNQGQGPWPAGEHWEYIDDPVRHCIQTQGLLNEPIRGSSKTQDDVQRMNRELSRTRSQEINSAVPKGENQWSAYPQTGLASPMEAVDEEQEVEAGTR
ncbi:MAG TPA: manganese catalase family protein [Armatimonadota bacterium]|nr:manganese catalase family protein [Armatimonadota bacterium]